MNRTVRRGALVAAVCGLLAAPAFAAEEATDDDAAHQAELAATAQANTDEVKAEMKRSADFLAAQPHFAFRALIAYEVLQANGSKLEFGATRTATVRRPDRLRVDTLQRDGDRRSVFFDGKQISIDLPTEQAYVAVAKPGTLDDAISYLVDDLDTPAPLHEFLSSNYYEGVKDAIASAFFVAEERLGERTCNHFALSTANVDAELWIEDGDRPLPCRLVVTYVNEPAVPQFRAEFEDWNLAPATPDSLFAYTPPAGAERLALQTAVEAVREEGRQP